MHASMGTATVADEMTEECEKATLWRLVREDVACVFQRDPAAGTRLEVITTYPGVHAIFCYRIANRLWRRGWRYLPRLISYLARIWTSIDIHPGATIGRRFFIDHGDGVVIGETAVVGDDVTLYHGVTLGGVSWNKGKRHPTLGDRVVVGAGAKILGPIALGSDVRVGANSVVISPVPEGRTVVGIPGKVVCRESAQEEGPDLNHHLIPDPVADAVSCLLERIRRLESELAIRNADREDTADERVCGCCDSQQVCDSLIRQDTAG